MEPSWIEPPDRLRPAAPGGPWTDAGDAGDVGDFRQGSPVSRWALARYLVGRALGEAMSTALFVLALLILGFAALVEWGLTSTFWAVLIAIVALGVLVMRAGLRAVLRRLTAADQFGPVESRLKELVADTRSDVRKELRRIGLPGRTWALPLLAFAFFGRERRRRTIERLRNFDVDRVVPASRIDELHLALRARGSLR